jgi:hypothetical protein
MIRVVVIVIFVLAATATYSQKQLVLLKGQDVLLRLNPGDDIRFKIKGQKQIIHSYVNNLLDGRLVTHRDTFLFANIERIYFHRPLRINVWGGTMMAGGILLFGIDQLNNSGIHGEEMTLDQGVTTASIALVGVGLPLLLVKKKSQKLTYKYRLLTVAEGSAFYRPDPRNGLQSPLH